MEKPRYVRVNTLVASREDVVGELREQGWRHKTFLYQSYEDYLGVIADLSRDCFVRDMHVPDCLVFPTRTEFFANPLYSSGVLVLQDKASLLPVHLLEPREGSVVLDMCAAPGMKTTHIAAIINNQGTVYAVERDARRYQTLCELVEQYGASCVETIHADALTVDAVSCPNVEYILVDPSCSGSGMVDRVASVKDRTVDLERLRRLAGFQLLLLKHALTSFPDVKRVVYSTCSLSVEENEQVVEEACALIASGASPHRFQLRRQFADDQWVSRGSDEYAHGPCCLYARPSVDLTNGFFVAVFERLADSTEENEAALSNSNEVESEPKKLKRKKSKKRKTSGDDS